MPLMTETFLTWSCAWGTANGLVTGGPVWWAELSSGSFVVVVATCGNGDSAFTLEVWTEPFAEPWGLYSAPEGDEPFVVEFDSLSEFREALAAY